MISLTTILGSQTGVGADGTDGTILSMQASVGASVFHRGVGTLGILHGSTVGTHLGMEDGVGMPGITLTPMFGTDTMVGTITTDSVAETVFITVK